MSDSPHVAILGAGPVGLDAALACSDAELPFTVYEAGPSVAHHVRAWGHVRLFTPWDLDISHRMRHHLTEAGRPLPAAGGGTPTGHDLAVHLLDPVARLPALAGRIRLRTRVLSVARAGLLKHEHIGSETRAAAPFRLLLDGPGGEHTAHADLVLDCTGTYAHPNMLGDGGIPALGERALGHRIVRTLPDPGGPGAVDRWAGTVLLVGAGKSAQTAARDLAALPRTRLEWIVRDPHPDWGEIHDDSLPGRRRLVETARTLASGTHDRVSVRTGTRVEALHQEGDRVRATLDTGTGTATGPRTVMADHVLALTGYAGDAALYRQLQVHECYATGAPMNLSATLLGSAGGDCLTQPSAGLEALRSPEPHFFVLGAKSYGRLGTFLLRAGYAQVDEVVTAYARPGTPTPATP